MTTVARDDDAERAEVSLIGRPLPAGIRRDVLVITAGDTISWHPDEHQARQLAVLEHGCVELVSRSGARLPLAEGAVFCLPAADLTAIHNGGTGAAVIATVYRREAPHP
jgi:hypothetical protein